MGDFKTKNGVLSATPKNSRVTGVLAGVNPLDAVNKAQLDAIQLGTIDLARIELSADGTAALPVITRDGDLNTGIYFIGADNVGVSAGGTLILDVRTTGAVVTGTFSATTAMSSTTTLAAGTSFNVGTDQTFTKELDHTISVSTTTTAATVGGKITVKGATGATSGNGGAAELIGGAAGATAGAAGGAVTITGGAQGAGLGVTGAVNITTPNATGGIAGNITLLPGTGSTTTVASVVIIGTNAILKPTGAPFFLIGTTASDGAFAKSIVGGYVELRGATGNVQLPTGAQLTTAVGTVTAGVSFTCVFNAIGATPMTAGNTATITTNTNAVIDASVGSTLVTVTSTSNVNIGVFRFTYDSANWIVSRV